MSGMYSIWRYVLGLAVGSAWVLTVNCAFSQQIVPDRTLPNNSTVTINGNTFNIAGGTQAGRNLFHSFQQFSVPNGGTASFNNGLDIQNIFSRVTGGSPSTIEGVIKALGNANVFFLNPNGIVFGKNASLNIGGSFVATTANAIQFGNQGTFSASVPNNPALLTVNPSALLYNQINAAASIQNNSQASVNGNTGLQVPNGKSLLLVGGNINLDGWGLIAKGGRVELAGLSAPGTIGLNVAGNALSLSIPNGVQLGDIFLKNQAFVDVSSAGGGDIAINARNLNMLNSGILGGIGTGLGNSSIQAGDIDINADAIFVDSGYINNAVSSNAKGNAGNLTIHTQQLLVQNGGQIGAGTFGAGNGGNLTVNANTIQLTGTTPDGKLASGLYTQSQGSGNAGNWTVNTQQLQVRNGALVSAGTFSTGNGGNLTVNANTIQLTGTTPDGKISSGLYTQANSGSTGKAGDLTINTQQLQVQNGAQVSTSTLGAGKGGNLNITADSVQVFGSSSNNQHYSNLSTETTQNVTGAGSAGNLTIKTRELLVGNGAYINSTTYGVGNGGNLTVNAKTIQLTGTSVKGQNAGGLFAETNSGSTGNAGNLTINTQQLQVQNGAQVSTSTLGAGKGGNLNITADSVQVFGSSSNNQHYSNWSTETTQNVTGAGSAGNLTIKTRELLVGNGAYISSTTYGVGNGGNLTVNAKTIQLTGTSVKGQNAGGLFAETNSGSTGKAGNLTINTQQLQVQNGAKVSASTSGVGRGGGLTITTGELFVNGGAQISAGTFSTGNGGNLTVNANTIQLTGTTPDGKISSGLYTQANSGSTGKAGDLTINTQQLQLQNGAVVSSSTFGKGNSGNLNVTADMIQLAGTSIKGQYAGGLFTEGTPSATGNASNLTINARQLLVQNESGVYVQNLGTGTAGNLNINARSLRLDNGGTLSANTRNNKIDPNQQQATITINSGDLILSRGSTITANASGTNVIGGNINIDTDVLAAVENSTISAKSMDSRGGQVKINAQGIFLSPDSIITARGATQQLNGTVQINTPETDPSHGLVILPTTTENTPKLVSSNCSAFNETAGGSSFTITGRGGLPPSPNDPLTSEALWTDTRLPVATAQQHQHKAHAIKAKPQPIAIIPATGWVRNNKGEVTLISTATNTTTVNTPTSCPVR